MKKMKKKKGKVLWWNESLNDAYDLYYFSEGTLSNDKKEVLFTKQIYPAFRTLAQSIVKGNDWHVAMKESMEDLVSELIAFGHGKAHLFDRTKGANRSSFIHLCMSRYCYQKWKKASNRCKMEVQDQYELEHDEDTSPISDRASLQKYVESYDFNLQNNTISLDKEFVKMCLEWHKQNLSKLISNPNNKTYRFLNALINLDTSELEFKWNEGGFLRKLAAMTDIPLGTVGRSLMLFRKLNQKLYSFYATTNRMPEGSEIQNFNLDKYTFTRTEKEK